jgi:fructose-bisphosphate aldolase class I
MTTREPKRARLEHDDSSSSILFGAPHLSKELKQELDETARRLCCWGKGISACDESAGTVGKRFESVGIANTEENRRKYRQMLFETEGIESYLSGVILDPETLYQKSSNCHQYFPEVLSSKGILPGVKPHLKVYALPGTNGDTVMQGLDSLAVRIRDYKQAGAKFAKWRSPLVINMSKSRPTDLAIRSNMRDLARYALICQSEGVMPIVEPDVSLVGTHTLEESVQINSKVQSELFKTMMDHGVYMSGATLKSNMVNPGKDCLKSYTAQEIADANLFVLRQCFPVAMKGNHFLSGGQTLEQAAARLSAINQQKKDSDPWNLRYVFLCFLIVYGDKNCHLLNRPHIAVELHQF